jgi:hypothetical protein
MSVTIFKDKDCKGASQALSGSIADLKDHPADKPSSIRITSDVESALLFKNDDWHGGALYIRGPKTVADLGSAKDGGRYGFGNSVRSIRLSAFTVHLNVNVVTNGPDDMPGVFPNRDWMDLAVRDVVKRANSFLISKRAMLTYEIARISYRNDPKQFDLSNLESWSFPNDWKEKDEIDVVFVDRFSKEGTGGRAKLPCFGKVVIIAARANLKDVPDPVLNTEDMAKTLVHEVGHYLGLGHGTADKNTKNIMFEDFAIGAPISDYELTVDQIRELHDRLANHHTRRGDRD